MKYLHGYTDKHSDVTTLFLIKEKSWNVDRLETFYTSELVKLGIDKTTVLYGTLKYSDDKKVTAKDAKDYLTNVVLPVTHQLPNLKHIVIADSTYFKTLTKAIKPSAKLGYSMPGVFDGFTQFTCFYTINYDALFHNDNLRASLLIGLQTYANSVKNNKAVLGADVINTLVRPTSVIQIQKQLQNLHLHEKLTCDIETFGLRFATCGLGTIAFSWSEHDGVFIDICHTNQEEIKTIRSLLRQFFEQYQGQLIFFNASFDVKILIYQLFMHDDPTNLAGLLKGIKVFRDKTEDAQLVAFLCLNSTAEVAMNLKALAYEYLGDYAEDEIADITKIPVDDLAIYNVKDCLGTWFVYHKYYPQLVDESLDNFYQTMHKQSLFMAIKMMLVGLPIKPDQVEAVELELQSELDERMNFLRQHPYIKRTEHIMNVYQMRKKNAELKKKIRPLTDFNTVFNPNSNNHLAVLLHDVMELPVLEETKTGLPSTGADILEELQDHTVDPAAKSILECLVYNAKVAKILSTFIPAFKNLPIEGIDGQYFLNGDLNIARVQSLRLSSSNPNLQNLPSGSTYGKKVKTCFGCTAEGWGFGGADFNALEARIGAIQTQDPNLRKIYVDGYDSHCLNTFAYYGDEMPDIVDTVESVNSIQELYPALRTASKPSTFALQYGGNEWTLHKRNGLPMETATKVVEGYNDTYQVAIAWADNNVQEAHKNGYVELAFGAKLRTPILKQTAYSKNNPTQSAAAEGRSANNAITQSWGLLTNRAAIEFEERLEQSPYQDKVFLCNVIHDAIYLIFKLEPEVIHWINVNLIECMEWNDHPAIKDDDIPMGAELDLYLDSWAEPITLENKCSVETITEILNNAIH